MKAELALKIGGTVAGLIGGFVTAVWEVFLSPLYAGSVPLPVSPILAVFSNLGLIWFTHRVTGRAGLALLPGIVWFGVLVVSAGRTSEGDLLLPGNDWMGLAALLVGTIAWGIGGYRMILAPKRPSAPRQAAKPPSTPDDTGPAAPSAPRPGTRSAGRGGSRPARR